VVALVVGGSTPQVRHNSGHVDTHRSYKDEAKHGPAYCYYSYAYGVNKGCTCHDVAL